MAKQVELSVRCVVKGYHECPFLCKYRGNISRIQEERRTWECVQSLHRGQLGRLQIELVSPLWPLQEKITV